MPLCTSDDTSLCTNDQACVLDLLGTPDAGLCIGDCNVFTGDGCGGQESCLLLGEQGANANEEIKIPGACLPNPNPGSQSTRTYF